MRRRPRILHLAALLALLAASPAAARDLRLPSGTTVDVTALARGAGGGLEIGYRSALDDPAGLRLEADELWSRLQAEAERNGFATARIAADRPGAPGFGYEKRGAAWRALEPTGGALDEARVRAVLDRLDRLDADLAVDGMMLYLADGWTLTLQPGPTDVEPTTLSRTDYAELGRSLIGVARQHRLSREITAIRLSPGGATAVVESRQTESVELRGRRIDSVAALIEELQLKDRVLLLVRSEAVMLSRQESQEQ